MNTQGWIRGLMSRKMSDANLFNHVAECINREFDENITTITTDCFCQLIIQGAEVFIPKDIVKNIRLKSPYRLDKYILDNIEKQGVSLDRSKSQYLRVYYRLN